MRDGVGSGEVTVAIPTYARVPYLARCLAALAEQTKLPDAVVVSRRTSDIGTADFVAHAADHLPFPVRTATVDAPGPIPAFSAGILAAQTDIVAAIDDDAIPPPTWVASIRETFLAAPPFVGGITGPAISEGKTSITPSPAILTWYGRFETYWDTKLADEAPREVCSFAEGNAAFRREALSVEVIDESIPDARIVQHGLDIALSLQKRGWRIWYVPALTIRHTPLRHASPVPTPKDCEQFCTVMVYILRKHRGTRGIVSYAAYTVLAGQWEAPGVLRALLRRDTRWTAVWATARACARAVFSTPSTRSARGPNNSHQGNA